MQISRYTLLRVSIILGLLAGFALSPRLWFGERLYPPTPVWSSLRPDGSAAGFVVMLLLAGALAAVSFAPRKWLLVVVFALLGFVALQDQSRWQPWFYQYFVMLLVVAVAGPERETAALDTCCLIIAATYFWSGLAKLNPNFAESTFPWLLGPLSSVRQLAYAAPIVEAALGVGLLIQRTRMAALWGAIGMHVSILLAIGPLGRHFNAVVWPWNLAMIAFLLILFFRRANAPGPADILWGRGFALHRVVLLLFGVLPAFSSVDLWDHYLSCALYSGNRNSGIVYVTDAMFERLPSIMQDHVFDEGAGRNGLDLNDWSLGELSVPSYPEPRVYRNVVRSICGYPGAGDEVELVIQRKRLLFNTSHRSVFRCADLR